MIFHDKPDQQLCDDDKLNAVLNDGDQTAEHQEVIEHIEQCSRCQQRFDELAAGAQDWTKVRQALLNDDPCSENRVGSAKWDYSLRNEGPVAWTESMASQLLSPASHPELLGRLGRYDVERLIGSGGMGVVFKAHDSELNRPVAIKILAPYLSSSGPARKRFAREARAAAAVVHEHVVPIYNVETEREIPFLVMHYIAGESLQGRIDREGALELCEILRIGMQVASGLSAAHQQGLVHRDIKPSNILMEQGVERALITDFGLARAADDASLTRTGFHPGTPQYMSPEQASGEQVDARSDLFSLGSVLYTMCTGRPPFRAETSLGVLRRITDVEPRPIREINPNVPEWLCRLVARLMSKSPDDRFVNANEVAELLKQCLAHVQQPTAVPLPTSLVPPATTVHRPIFKSTRPGVLKMLGFIGMPILGMVLWQAMDPPANNLQQSTVHGVATLESVISDVTITEKTATVSGRNGKDMDCVLRIGKSKKNEQLEWATPVTGKFSATITASDQIASDDGQVMKGIVFTIQNEKVLGTSNIAMSGGDPVPAGEVRFRQLSAMNRADTFWTFGDIHCDDGTTIPISILLRANKPLLPAGPLVYKGKVQEWVGGDRDGEPGRVFEDNYKPVPNATLQLYKVSPIVKGGAGYQFEEIAVFKTDKAGYYNVNIPDDLKRFIPTPHTKEWNDWDSLLLVTTSAPGFATNSMTLAANYNIPSIELARGTSFNGRLVNENGKPVVGARVTVNEQSRSREREMDGWLGQTSSKPLQADKFDATDADAMLVARTRASIANHSVGWIPPMIEGVMTDSDGRFTIDGIGTNDLLDLKVEATGYKDSSIKVIGRDIKTAYSRDPFASGENIAVHGRNFQVTLVASDRNTIHNRHRVLKGNQEQLHKQSARLKSDAHLAAAEKEYQQLELAEEDLRAAYGNAIDNAKSDEDRERAENQFDQRNVYTPKYLAFEEKYRGTPAGLKALIKVVRFARSTLSGPAPAGRVEAVDRLIDHYVAFDGIEQAFDDLRGGLPVPREKELLKAVLEKNPSRHVQAESLIAQLELIRVTLSRHANIEALRERVLHPEVHHPEFWRENDKAVLQELESTNPDQFRAEMKSIIERLEEFSYVHVAKYGMAYKAARHLSHSINKVVIGKPAPEIKAINSAGKQFQLSTLRGSTVLLVFGLNHSSDNDVMYAPLRKLAEDYKSRHVEVVMILESDEDKFQSAAALKRHFPWTVIQETSAGPLSLDWGVRGYPTVFFIDPKGVLQSLTVGLPCYDDNSGYDATEVATELDKLLASKQSHNNDGAKGQSGTDAAKPLYADLQGDWIIDSFYIDEDANSRELQKQGSTALILRTIRVEANELYFRNPPVAGMTRTSGAISLKPVEGNDPRLFSVVDSQENFRFGMYKVDGDKLTILLTHETPPKLLTPTEGEFYIECHRAVSEDDKELLDVINKNPDQIDVIDLILKDFQKSAPAQGDTTTTGKDFGTEKPSPAQTPDKSNGESMDLFQEVAPPSTPDATSKLDFFTEGFHKLVITGNTCSDSIERANSPAW